jgi:NarL family two-component system response regulator LiaR
MGREKPGRQSTIHIVIADDHELFRQVLELTLIQDGMEVVQSVSTGREAVEATLKHKPELLLLDVAMPDMDGLAALSTIHFLSPETHVIIISGLTDPLYMARAGELGAKGYFSKGVSPSELVESIHAILSGEKPQVATRRIEEPAPPSLPGFTFPKEAPQPPDAEELTEQESLILSLIAMGLDNQSIMDKLCISKNTLKTHTRNIFSKLDVSNRTQAAIWALQHGYRADVSVEN